MKKYCIGVDVGGTSVKLGLFYHNGTGFEKMGNTDSKG